MYFNLKPHKIELILCPILIITSLLISFSYFFIQKDDGKSVSVYIHTKLEYSLDLNTNQTLTLKKGEYNRELNQFPYLQGDMLIEIKNKKVRVEKEESPLHVCSKQGYVSTPNMPILCAPNSVLVLIESKQVQNITIIV